MIDLCCNNLNRKRIRQSVRVQWTLNNCAVSVIVVQKNGSTRKRVVLRDERVTLTNCLRGTLDGSSACAIGGSISRPRLFLAGVVRLGESFSGPAALRPGARLRNTHESAPFARRRCDLRDISRVITLCYLIYHGSTELKRDRALALNLLRKCLIRTISGILRNFFRPLLAIQSMAIARSIIISNFS